MPGLKTLNLERKDAGATNQFTIPKWIRVKVQEGAVHWEAELCRHKLFGTLAIRVAYWPANHHGYASIYRDGAFIYSLPVPNTEKWESVDVLKSEAWEATRNFLAQSSAYLQDYVAYASEVRPTSEA